MIEADEDAAAAAGFAALGLLFDGAAALPVVTVRGMVVGACVLCCRMKNAAKNTN